MPRLTLEQQDAVNEAIDRQTFRIRKVFKAFFKVDPTDEEMRRMHNNIKVGVNQAIQQMNQPPGGSRVVGPPALGAPARDLQFQSTQPISSSIGPPRPVDELRGSGFSAALPLITNQGYLNNLKNQIRGPI